MKGLLLLPPSGHKVISISLKDLMFCLELAEDGSKCEAHILIVKLKLRETSTTGHNGLSLFIVRKNSGANTKGIYLKMLKSKQVSEWNKKGTHTGGEFPRFLFSHGFDPNMGIGKSCSHRFTGNRISKEAPSF
uniref:Uncharacterized protein n=1 Tax=Pipistrellus kuhlii TaxID=59472 RepID=A0A7J7T1Q6_PIPKU|nr:hypothetical protein mPipKuh1_009714 [Pipistrellus kuhlii]